MRKMWMIILALAAVLALTGCSIGVEEHEYAEEFAADCELLTQICREGTDKSNEIWLSEWLFHYQIQPDGHGLAFVLHPYGLDASGTTPMVIYETADGGKSWRVLQELFKIERGQRAFVYMGEIVVLAADCSKGVGGSLVISYDRGHTWSEAIPFDELIDYDPWNYENLEPYIINYNAHTGIITFGWKDGYSYESDEYILINQFDANTCRFVEEVYRSLVFSRVT